MNSDNIEEKSFKGGQRASFHIGVEFRDNPDGLRTEYKDRAAAFFREGVDRFVDLTPKEKAALCVAFYNGEKS